MVTKQKAREDILRWIEAINSRDTMALDQVVEKSFAADFVWHFPGVAEDLPPGPAGVKLACRGILVGIPNFRPMLEDLFVEGTKWLFVSAFGVQTPTAGSRSTRLSSPSNAMLATRSPKSGSCLARGR